ncbi:MAG TPA: DUF2933 domain-containing protein [Deltaproteobacteria bacterium]|nr:DUF2933 domain-containing protein [Deltaproteobacteria bacterium]
MIEFIQSNWFWILLVLAFVGMHTLGPGCCGAGHHSRRKKEAPEESEGQGKSCH